MVGVCVKAVIDARMHSVVSRRLEEEEEEGGY
jgi:hypothetical protein